MERVKKWREMWRNPAIVGGRDGWGRVAVEFGPVGEWGSGEVRGLGEMWMVVGGGVVVVASWDGGGSGYGVRGCGCEGWPDWNVDDDADSSRRFVQFS